MFSNEVIQLLNKAIFIAKKYVLLEKKYFIYFFIIHKIRREKMFNFKSFQTFFPAPIYRIFSRRYEQRPLKPKRRTKMGSRKAEEEAESV
jgi:hypothetical protein